jgi:methyl-accepting chemotaxis protein
VVQRRLIVALVGVALASVLLVGAGVLILAQIGARAQTESKIDQDLGALAELMASSRPGDGLRSQEGLRGSLNLDRLDLVAVDSQGNVYRLEPGRGRPRERPLLDDHDASLVLTLASDAFERYLGGETILEDRPSRGLTTVTGLRMINYDPSEVGYERTLGLMATKSVVTVGRNGKLWFALSAATVVALSVAVAWLLARRLTKPILAIEQVTASIAAGDFTARVAVEGNDELAGLGRSVNRMAADLPSPVTPKR